MEPNSGKIMEAHSAPKMDAKLKIKYVLCKSCQKCAGLSHRKQNMNTTSTRPLTDIKFQRP